jgi:hypothetical protein
MHFQVLFLAAHPVKRGYWSFCARTVRVHIAVMVGVEGSEQ